MCVPNLCLHKRLKLINQVDTAIQNPNIENRYIRNARRREAMYASMVVNLVLIKIYFICATHEAHKFATWAELCNSVLAIVFICHIHLFILLFSVGFCFISFVVLREALWAHRTCLLILSLDGIKWPMCNLFYDEQCLSIWHTIHLRVTRTSTIAAASLPCFPFFYTDSGWQKYLYLSWMS